MQMKKALSVIMTKKKKKYFQFSQNKIISIQNIVNVDIQVPFAEFCVLEHSIKCFISFLFDSSLLNPDQFNVSTSINCIKGMDAPTHLI